MGLRRVTFFFFLQNGVTALPGGYVPKATWEFGEALNVFQLHKTTKPRFSQVYHEDTVPAELKGDNTRESLCEGQKIMFTTKQRVMMST